MIPKTGVANEYLEGLVVNIQTIKIVYSKTGDSEQPSVRCPILFDGQASVHTLDKSRLFDWLNRATNVCFINTTK